MRRVATKMCIYYDIDGATTEEELKSALIESAETENTDAIEVRSLRIARNGNQTAIIEVSKDTAERLLRRGRVRIGWVHCRIKKWINVVRCYKCLEFGHIASVCKGMDRSDECRNCGRTGHKAKECENKSYCRSCKCQDHRADSSKCPRFRRLLETGRRNSIKDTGRAYHPEEDRQGQSSIRLDG